MIQQKFNRWQSVNLKHNIQSSSPLPEKMLVRYFYFLYFSQPEQRSCLFEISDNTERRAVPQLSASVSVHTFSRRCCCSQSAVPWRRCGGRCCRHAASPRECIMIDDEDGRLGRLLRWPRYGHPADLFFTARAHVEWKINLRDDRNRPPYSTWTSLSPSDCIMLWPSGSSVDQVACAAAGRVPTPTHIHPSSKICPRDIRLNQIKP